MKKSVMYKEAQLSVLRDELLDNMTKLAIIKILQSDEDIAVLVETSAEKKAAESEE